MKLIQILSVLILPVSVLAQPKGKDVPPSELVSKDVREGWEKAGARLMGMEQSGKRVPSLSFGDYSGPPVFHFAKPKDVKVEALPDPMVPFCVSVEEIGDLSLMKLARFKTLHGFFNKYSPWTEAKAKELASLKQLKILKADIGSDDLREVILASVGGLSELISLELFFNGKGLTPEAIAIEPLAKLKKLQHLSLTLSKLNAGSAKTIAGFSDLRTLELTGKITDDDAKHFSALSKLTTLNLQMGGALTDSGVKHLSGLSNLTEVNLGYNKISDSGVAEIAKLTELEYLYLNNNPITDAALKDLSGLPKLRFLDLSTTKITDKALSDIAGMESLKEVRLFSINFSPEAVKKLKAARPDLRVHVTEKKK